MVYSQQDEDSQIAYRLDNIAVCPPHSCFPMAQDQQLPQLAADIQRMEDQQDYDQLRQVHIVYGWSKCLDAMHLSAAHRHLLPAPPTVQLNQTSPH